MNPGSKICLHEAALEKSTDQQSRELGSGPASASCRESLQVPSSLDFGTTELRVYLVISPEPREGEEKQLPYHTKETATEKNRPKN